MHCSYPYGVDDHCTETVEHIRTPPRYPCLVGLGCIPMAQAGAKGSGTVEDPRALGIGNDASKRPLCRFTGRAANRLAWGAASQQATISPVQSSIWLVRDGSPTPALPARALWRGRGSVRYWLPPASARLQRRRRATADT